MVKKERIDIETKQLLNSLINIVETVEDAITKNANQAAFFCSLSIPDIAAQIDYPDLRGNGKVGERYIKWYNENVYKYENPSESILPKLNRIDGNIMYLIRCKLYHQGDYLHDDIIKKLSKKYGDKVKLSLNYSFNDRRFSMFCDEVGIFDKIEIDLNMLDVVNKLKWNAEGVLREYE